MTVRKIRLLTSQHPAGETVHELWAGAQTGELYKLHVFEGFTEDMQTLEFTPEAPLENVRYVRVLTKTSPSWVSWREIEVLQ